MAGFPRGPSTPIIGRALCGLSHGFRPRERLSGIPPSAMVGRVLAGTIALLRFPMKSLIAAVLCSIGFTTLAAAQTPVAVVEDVQGKVTGVEFMDYVAPGKVIKLGPGGMVVLGYMKTCWRETITGIGTVIVGAEERMVHLGEVKAGKVQCDSSQSQPVSREVGESAATVVRSLNEAKRPAAPQLTLYG